MITKCEVYKQIHMECSLLTYLVHEGQLVVLPQEYTQHQSAPHQPTLQQCINFQLNIHTTRSNYNLT